MEVILLERIEKLGQMGDVVTVKPGFARNYLLPKKKALRATEANKAEFETKRVQLETTNLTQRNEAKNVGDKMGGCIVTLIRQAGEAGQLFGSVNARDIAGALTDSGFTISRQQVRLDTPIKAIGLHQVQVSLHPEVTITVVANIARAIEEAEIQTRTGKAVISEAEREAEAAADDDIAEQAVEMFEGDAVPDLSEANDAEEKDNASKLETENETSDDAAASKNADDAKS